MHAYRPWEILGKFNLYELLSLQGRKEELVYDIPSDAAI